MRVDPEIKRFLESLPTITAGQGADLKIETTLCRVWLTRATTEDGKHVGKHLAGQVELEIRLYDEDSKPGDEHRPVVWEERSTPLARQFANTALVIAGYAGRVKI